ncbi:hypothetical protein B481_3327 [Planococcus halocryophilus Or1]|nr:hypothetical protein B481_3327 [Planococcus halocryophilus Or1]
MEGVHEAHDGMKTLPRKKFKNPIPVNWIFKKLRKGLKVDRVCILEKRLLYWKVQILNINKMAKNY